jgi:aerobic-type carbon monoxide dehydrogenase small subunit (CoxS/CutS family)
MTQNPPLGLASKSLIVNGRPVDVQVTCDDRLLDTLRGSLGLKGTKEACGRGECGACTVLIGGKPVMACLVLTQLVTGPVTTIEGVAHECTDLREAFADCGAFQCGFCTPGQIVRASVLLQEEWPADPCEHEMFVRHRMSGNICRCTGYTGIVKAIIKTAKGREAASQPESGS